MLLGNRMPLLRKVARNLGPQCAMNIVLFDTPQAREALQPFSYTRALAKMRIGIATVEEKWQHYLGSPCSFLTAAYLREKFPLVATQDNWCINSTVCPNKALAASIQQLDCHQKLVQGNTCIAVRCDRDTLHRCQTQGWDALSLETVAYKGPLLQLRHVWDFFLHNPSLLLQDWAWIRTHRTSQPLQDPHTSTYHPHNIFLEEGVTTKAALLNAEAGPIYLGKNVTLHEGVIIKGPVAILEGAQISAGARIGHGTTIGPYAKVGGEVSHSLFLGYSNKAHDGFMGHSVIGEWCNLGAGTQTSNLRNDYKPIQVGGGQAYTTAPATDLQFCGLFMGDHSKCGINTSLNAGTTLGVFAQVPGGGWADKVVPSFTWGTLHGPTTTYVLDKALEAAERMMQRRSVSLTPQDKAILTHVFAATAAERSQP